MEKLEMNINLKVSNDDYHEISSTMHSEILTDLEIAIASNGTPTKNSDLYMNVCVVENPFDSLHIDESSSTLNNPFDVFITKNISIESETAHESNSMSPENIYPSNETCNDTLTENNHTEEYTSISNQDAVINRADVIDKNPANNTMLSQIILSIEEIEFEATHLEKESTIDPPISPVVTESVLSSADSITNITSPPAKNDVVRSSIDSTSPPVQGEHVPKNPPSHVAPVPRVSRLLRPAGGGTVSTTAVAEWHDSKLDELPPHPAVVLANVVPIPQSSRLLTPTRSFIRMSSSLSDTSPAVPQAVAHVREISEKSRLLRPTTTTTLLFAPPEVPPTPVVEEISKKSRLLTPTNSTQTKARAASPVAHSAGTRLRSSACNSNPGPYPGSTSHGFSRSPRLQPQPHSQTQAQAQTQSGGGSRYSSQSERQEAAARANKAIKERRQRDLLLAKTRFQLSKEKSFVHEVDTIISTQISEEEQAWHMSPPSNAASQSGGPNSVSVVFVEYNDEQRTSAGDRAVSPSQGQSVSSASIARKRSSSVGNRRGGTSVSGSVNGSIGVGKLGSGYNSKTGLFGDVEVEEERKSKLEFYRIQRMMKRQEQIVEVMEAKENLRKLGGSIGPAGGVVEDDSAPSPRGGSVRSGTLTTETHSRRAGNSDGASICSSMRGDSLGESVSWRHRGPLSTSLDNHPFLLRQHSIHEDKNTNVEKMQPLSKSSRLCSPTRSSSMRIETPEPEKVKKEVLDLDDSSRLLSPTRASKNRNFSYSEEHSPPRVSPKRSESVELSESILKHTEASVRGSWSESKAKQSALQEEHDRVFNRSYNTNALSATSSRLLKPTTATLASQWKKQKGSRAGTGSRDELLEASLGGDQRRSVSAGRTGGRYTNTPSRLMQSTAATDRGSRDKFSKLDDPCDLRRSTDTHGMDDNASSGVRSLSAVPGHPASHRHRFEQVRSRLFHRTVSLDRASREKFVRPIDLADVVHVVHSSPTKGADAARSGRRDELQSKDASQKEGGRSADARVLMVGAKPTEHQHGPGSSFAASDTPWAAPDFNINRTAADTGIGAASVLDGAESTNTTDSALISDVRAPSVDSAASREEVMVSSSALLQADSRLSSDTEGAVSPNQDEERDCGTASAEDGGEDVVA